jgi:uncharacterized protein YdaU (DUF1376 family)
MATNERFAAFLFYVEDWLSSTAIDLMTAAEERGYLRLLLHAWKNPDCGLPNDDRILAHLSKLETEWQTGSGEVVRAEFFERDGRLYNERLLRERENQRAVREARSGAGKAGAESRWHSKRIADGEAITPADSRATKSYSKRIPDGVVNENDSRAKRTDSRATKSHSKRDSKMMQTQALNSNINTHTEDEREAEINRLIDAHLDNEITDTVWERLCSICDDDEIAARLQGKR